MKTSITVWLLSYSHTTRIFSHGVVEKEPVCIDSDFGKSGARGKEPACQCRRHKRGGFEPWLGKITCRRKRQPTPVFLPGEFHGQRSLTGYSPLSHKESERTEVTWHAQAFCLISWPLPLLLLSAGKNLSPELQRAAFFSYSTSNPLHCVFPM